MWALVVAPYDQRLFYHLGGLRSPIFALLHREASLNHASDGPTA